MDRDFESASLEQQRDKERRTNLLESSLAYNSKYGITKCRKAIFGIDGENATNTKDRIPDETVDSWIHYWQIRTCHNENEMTCTCCGKHIFDDTDTQKCKIIASRLNVEPTALKAVGGHITISGHEGYYITPLCPHCNSIDKAKVILHPGDYIVEEEHTRIIDKK